MNSHEYHKFQSNSRALDRMTKDNDVPQTKGWFLEPEMDKERKVKDRDN